ncbi:MAG: PASTA domain-containing protein [Dethiobacter sp.]|jgi:serine/threonine-protein kinase|nr:PASTA domain-containing protein [Dethiobacter sp.]MBS3900619.1 PASTA domain-containing protein [Dethiobacter sp.]MBS3990214.1 PASTA domain-containing protein [Dethiobacter sp.]
MIGKILGKRYQVVEKIGDGGTAFVFKGMDNLLNRHVTIKVLRPEYVSDLDFVRRFRREAQAAASLSHPNIVSIYDVGEEDGIRYIVMEYIQGQSLKELIDDLGRLPVRMAVDYACQIAHALSKAHKHGIIHRDIKPHNILIGEDGRLKVTDFGIAQAVTASTVTYSDAFLGSVHYFSPEQASGGQTDEKSDIYSLGIVLFEMLTGKVPYSGDSPVSVALKHIQEPFPKPREINSQIPIAVERIIRKAAEKNPENRYISAREMSGELSNFLNGKENVATEQLFTPNLSQTKNLNSNKKRRLKPIHRAALVAALLMIALLIYGVLTLRAYWIVPDVEVPVVEGELLSQAASILADAGLAHRVSDQVVSDLVPAGYVISQSPAAGRVVKKGREIELVLSTGPDLVEVADVMGKMVREATLLLEGQGFAVEVLERHSEELSGTVIAQNPGRGHRISRGSTVTINVSIGGKPFPVRDLRGLNLEDAKKWLELFGLELRFVAEDDSDTFTAGQVIDQIPAAGELVQAGTLVDLTVSKGPGQPGLQRHEIQIPTNDIPVGEEVTVIVRDAAGERTEKFRSTGEQIVTFGLGSGEVEVRWQNNVEIRNFP